MTLVKNHSFRSGKNLKRIQNALMKAFNPCSITTCFIYELKKKMINQLLPV